MWARVCEFMLGCWMAVSPWVFRHSADETMYWAADWTVAILATTLACLSYWHPTRHAHLVTAGMAVVMMLYGRFAGGLAEHPPAALQNHIVVGLLLVMFAVIPNYTSHPPRAWYGEGGPSVSESP